MIEPNKQRMDLNVSQAPDHFEVLKSNFKMPTSDALLGRSNRLEVPNIGMPECNKSLMHSNVSHAPE